MSPTRRTLLKGIGGVAVAGVAIQAFQASTVPTTGQVLGRILEENVFEGAGAAAAVDITDDLSLDGFSNDVSIRAVSDPANPGQGRGGRDDVVHITSIPEKRGDGDDGRDSSQQERLTYDYGISLANVESQRLTVDELASSDGGFSYDWRVTNDDIVGVSNDHQQRGVGPDEAWLVLQEPVDDEDERQSDSKRHESGLRARGLEDVPRFIFRTMYEDAGTGQWNTRTVSDELDESNGQWREADVGGQRFSDLSQSPLDKYGDYVVRAVGIGRGDPFWGPSVLDTFYSNLEVGGQTYPLPVTADASQRRPGRGNN